MFGDKENNYVYANTWMDGLYAFGYDENDLFYLDKISIDGTGWAVWVDDNGFIYSARGEEGLFIHSFDGSELIEITSNNSFYTYGVWGDGTYVYTSGGDGIHAWGFDGSTLTYFDTIPLASENPCFVWANESYIYLTSDTKYVHVFSFDGESLTQLDTIETVTDVFGQVGSNNYIFGALEGNGLYIFDFDGTEISYVDSKDDGGAYYGLHYSNGFINVGRCSSGLIVYSYDGDSITTVDSVDNRSNVVWSDGDYVFYGGTNEVGMYDNTDAVVETVESEVSEDTIGGGGDLQGDDADGDGLADDEEEKYGTNPYDIDSDNDGWSDYEEIKYGSDPLDPNDYPGKVEELFFGIYLFLIGLLCLLFLFLWKI